MSRPLLWVALFLILLLPSAAGRVLLDVAGGLMILFLALPILITGAGWVGWRLIQARMVTCESCGASSFINSDQCPICGSTSLAKNTNQKVASKEQSLSTPASSATIDVSAEDAGKD